MKILFITNDYRDAIISRLKMRYWFKRKKKIDIDIAAPLESNNNDANQFGIILFPSRGISLSNIIRLRKLQGNYDLIIYRGIENILLSVFAKKNVDTIFLLTGLGRLFSEELQFKIPIRKIYKTILKRLIKLKNAKLIAQNEIDKQDLELARVFVIGGSGFNPSHKIEQKENLNNTIISVTRLDKSKGLYEIFDMCTLILQKNLEINYFILGDYSTLGLKERKRIEKFNESSNIFFVGYVNNPEMYYLKSTYAYFPTHYREGSPRFLIEALAYGLIIFSNSMPGCTEIVGNNNGYLDLSPSEILNKIKTLPYKEKSNMSFKAVQHFLSKYHEDVIFEEYFKIFTE